jgi:hypothetical protein
MSASIGSTTFITLGQSAQNGQILWGARVMEYEEQNWPGVDGNGYWAIGTRGGKAAVQGFRDLNTYSDAQEFIRVCEQTLSGTLQTVTDSLGNTWSNVLVMLRNYEILPIATASGGLDETASNYLVHTFWEFTRTEAIPAP